VGRHWGGEPHREVLAEMERAEQDLWDWAEEQMLAQNRVVVERLVSLVDRVGPTGFVPQPLADELVELLDAYEAFEWARSAPDR
jgi:hypothetical protein